MTQDSDIRQLDQCPECESQRLVDRDRVHVPLFSQGGGVCSDLDRPHKPFKHEVSGQECLDCRCVSPLVPVNVRNSIWRDLDSKAKKRQRLSNEQVAGAAGQLGSYFEGLAVIDKRIAEAAQEVIAAIEALEGFRNENASEASWAANMFGGVPEHLCDLTELRRVSSTLTDLTELAPHWGTDEAKAATARFLGGLHNQRAIADGLGMSQRGLQKAIERSDSRREIPGETEDVEGN